MITIVMARKVWKSKQIYFLVLRHIFSVHVLIYYTLVLCCDRTSLSYIACSLPGYHCDTCGITVHPEKVSSETCYNNSMWCNNIRVYRAVASYVTTVNQLYISLLILDYLRYLPRLCGKRVVSCTMNSEREQLGT